MVQETKAIHDRLTGVINQFSLRSVLFAVFGVLIAAGVLMALLTELTKDQAVDALNRFIGVDNKIADLCLRSVTAMGNARRYEKEFMLSYRDFGFNEARSRYISRVLTSVADIQESMEEVRLLADDREVDRQTGEVDKAIVEYRDRLLDMVAKYGKAGSYNSGLELVFRDVAHEMEDELRRQGNDKLIADLFSMRRKEKDFIERNRDSDVAGFLQTVTRFKADTALSGMPLELKKKIGLLANAYRARFEEYAKTMEEIRTIKSSYLKSVQVVEPTLEKLYARSDIKARERLVAIKRSQRVFTLLKVCAALLCLLMVLVISSAVYRVISKRVDESKSFAEQVAGGNLDIRLAVQGNNEFATLDNALNGMAESLQNAELARTKWTAELLKSEQEVRTLNQELEQKVVEKTKQLVAAQDELVRKEKLAILGRLAANVGNELRNPLGVMNNAVFFLKDALSGADDVVREYLDIIKKELENAQRVISDSVDFFRTKKPKPHMVALSDIMNESIRQSEVPNTVSVELDIPDTLPIMNIDPMQIRQVFHNLITNAVQAMPGGGSVRVSARLTRDEGRLTRDEKSSVVPASDARDRPSSIEISVTDTGEGISPENIKKLFQPLFSTKSRGVGLGLAICRNFVEANGGTIQVASEAGKGTTLTITLPAEETEP